MKPTLDNLTSHVKALTTHGSSDSPIVALSKRIIAKNINAFLKEISELGSDDRKRIAIASTLCQLCCIFKKSHARFSSEAKTDKSLGVYELIARMRDDSKKHIPRKSGNVSDLKIGKDELKWLRVNHTDNLTICDYWRELDNAPLLRLRIRTVQNGLKYLLNVAEELYKPYKDQHEFVDNIKQNVEEEEAVKID